LPRSITLPNVEPTGHFGQRANVPQTHSLQKDLPHAAADAFERGAHQKELPAAPPTKARLVLATCAASCLGTLGRIRSLGRVNLGPLRRIRPWRARTKQISQSKPDHISHPVSHRAVSNSSDLPISCHLPLKLNFPCCVYSQCTSHGSEYAIGLRGSYCYVIPGRSRLQSLVLALNCQVGVCQLRALHRVAIEVFSFT